VENNSFEEEFLTAEDSATSSPLNSVGSPSSSSSFMYADPADPFKQGYRDVFAYSILSFFSKEEENTEVHPFLP
jgi:hypothetical protein